MADFPVAKTVAVPDVTPIQAKHLNNLEDKVGIDSDPNPLSLDNRVATVEIQVDVDHDAAGHHKSGVWHIGTNVVASTAPELNKLSGAGPQVTPANLTALTDGSSVPTLHSHPMGLKIVYGNINADGSIYSGSGDFTVTHPSTGRYIITFTPAFATIPSIGSTNGQRAGVGQAGYLNLATGGGYPGFPTLSSVEIQPRTYSANGLFDCGFSFIAIGT